MDRRTFVKSASIAGACALAPAITELFSQDSSSLEALSLTVRADRQAQKLSHFWSECIGSDRAIVATRAQWLSDLELVHKTVGVKSVRFHGLFNDEMGVWPSGSKQPNFLYVDTVFDAMVERGVKPYVELSFMPGALASGTRTIFSYRGNTTPPKDMTQWGELVKALGEHCVNRYGIQEVSTWNFEVWNEPNIVFWTGTKPEYFELYRQSALALKEINKNLRVGGPSTALAAWTGDLLNYCAEQQLPIDFVSTHIYPDDNQKLVFGEGVHYPFEEVIPRSLAKVRNEIKGSKIPEVPLYISEWSSQNPAFIAHTIKGAIGLADILSYWTFDNVFEELGVPKGFFNNSFGLIGQRGVPRPSYYTFVLLNELGEEHLESDEGPLIATRRKDGSLAVLAWNLIPQPLDKRSSVGDPLIQVMPEYERTGKSLKLTLNFQGVHQHHVRVRRVDAANENFHRVYEKMGSPAYPSVDQIAQLKDASEPGAPEAVALNSQKQISITIPPNGVALVELS